MLHDVLDKNEAFLDYFLVTHDFGRKFQFFLYLILLFLFGFFQKVYPMILAKKFNISFIYLFLEIKPEYVQNAVLDEKKDALLFYKNVHFLKSQKLDFSKGVNPFSLSRIW